MSNILQITPFMLVKDIDSALDFFTNTLGFTLIFRGPPEYAYREREAAAIRILEEGPGNPAQPGTRRYAYYIDVRDVDALYAELQPKLDLLPEKDVRAPFDQPYNQRELLVLAPDGNLIAFGQAIPKISSQSDEKG